MNPDRWLRIAGVGTWAATAIPAVAGVSSGRLVGWALVWWAAASIVFVAAFSGMCWVASVRQSRGASLAMLVAQVAAALIMVGVGQDGLAAQVLLVVVAGQLLAVFEPAHAALWIAAQTGALIWVFSGFIRPLQAVTYGLACGGFQVFALGATALAVGERRAREQLALANTELHASRALLAESARVAERLRISRDLHDTLGHHLTALSLQLDVASRLADGKAADHVRQAHALTRLLLADVRDVVSQVRDGARFDLATAVRALIAQPAGSLTIHLEAPDTIPVDDAHAHALLRCVQEIVTNAVRHAQARNLWIAVDLALDGVTVRGRDDGRGAPSLAWGHGLTGMRERFEAQAGRVEIRTRAGHGFEVHGFIPTRAAL